jgi:3-isopropylmalate/(R)-2-methylmalate dehydratase small subunit
VKNGILLIVLDEKTVDQFFKETAANPGYQLAVDLEKQTITKPDGSVVRFDVEASRKHILLNGLDDIGLTLQHAEAIKAFEAKARTQTPWLYTS